MKTFPTYTNYTMFMNESASQSNVLIGKLFQSRDLAHLFHLATESYAKHKALNEYYVDLLELIDRFVEAYQGEFGKITITIPESSTISNDILFNLTELRKEVTELKENDMYHSLSAILDEILELISTTIYKLKELK